MEVSVGRDSAANPAIPERSGKRIDVGVIAVDFTVFTFFAANIARQFFPSDNPTAALLAAWTTFGVGFLTRPLGGIVLGAYADRHGRKAALLVTISVMALGVDVIAFAHTYS